MNTSLIIDGIGWIGAGALLAAYALVSMKRVEGNAASYQMLNLVGGVFLVVNTAYYGAFPSTFLNVIWAGVAVLTLAHAHKKLNSLWPRKPDDS